MIFAAGFWGENLFADSVLWDWALVWLVGFRCGETNCQFVLEY